ncbi:MAG: UDP-N-acetylmuramate--L-alanine ligase [Massiliimalia sp.]|jgi:UDP-N-acetylmuramate--alanine ligase
MNLNDSILKGKKHIHFIGIGGSGMYPLAQILHSLGYYLTGSDNNPTDTVEKVRALGIPVTIGQKAENISGADLIVHTAAILPDNEELVAAQNSGIPMLERADLLGILTSHFQNAVCISGTHGKTTTSAMLTQILLDADADPTAVIGGKLASIDGSGRIGKSEHMVCESCEFKDHFLKLDPDIAVILNVDEDHMEYFKTLDNLLHSFQVFCENAKKLIIYNGDDANTHKVVDSLEKEKISFGFSDQNDYYPANIIHQGGVHTTFDLMYRGTKLTQIDLFVPGIHNVLNACAACAAAIASGVPASLLNRGMTNFKGAGRRFEVLYHEHGITVVDDYGHHPAEIQATLTAAKELGYQRVIAVHQPFTYSRTLRLMDDFAKVLQLADVVVLSEIMGSRETNTLGVYTKDLAEKIPGCIWFPEFPEIADYVASIAKEGDIIITMGCGDVNKCAHMIVERLKK